MPVDSGRVFAAKPDAASGGVLFRAPNSGKPTTAVSALTTGWTAGGYIHEDGVEREESRDVSEIKSWGGLTIRRSQTGFGTTLAFRFLEYLNPDVAGAIYGTANVTVTAATAGHGEQIIVNIKGIEAPHKAWLFDMYDGVAKLRVYVGDGQVTETGTVTYNQEGGATRDVTVTAYPDVNGDYVVEFSDDGRPTP